MPPTTHTQHRVGSVPGPGLAFLGSIDQRRMQSLQWPSSSAGWALPASAFTSLPHFLPALLLPAFVFSICLSCLPQGLCTGSSPAQHVLPLDIPVAPPPFLMASVYVTSSERPSQTSHSVPSHHWVTLHRPRPHISYLPGHWWAESSRRGGALSYLLVHPLELCLPQGAQ